MVQILINVAKDFSRTPGPRYIREGEYSGQLFRQSKLYPAVLRAIQEGGQVLLDLDGGAGYGTSFLEEISGGLIREHHLKYDDILRVLKIKSMEEDYLEEDIRHYLNEANEQEAHLA